MGGEVLPFSYTSILFISSSRVVFFSAVAWPREPTAGAAIIAFCVTDSAFSRLRRCARCSSFLAFSQVSFEGSSRGALVGSLIYLVKNPNGQLPSFWMVLHPPHECLSCGAGPPVARTRWTDAIPRFLGAF